MSNKQTNKQASKQVTKQTNQKKGFEKREQYAPVRGSMNCSSPFFLGCIPSRWASSPVIHAVNNRYKWPYKLGIMSSQLQLGGGPSCSFIYPASLFKQVMAGWISDREKGKVAEQLGFSRYAAPLENSHFSPEKGPFLLKGNETSEATINFQGETASFQGLIYTFQAQGIPRLNLHLPPLEGGPHGHQVMQHHQPGKRSKVQGPRSGGLGFNLGTPK